MPVHAAGVSMPIEKTAVGDVTSICCDALVPRDASDETETETTDVTNHGYTRPDCRGGLPNHEINETALNFFILDSRRVLPPAPSGAGCWEKNNLMIRFLTPF